MSDEQEVRVALRMLWQVLQPHHFTIGVIVGALALALLLALTVVLR